MYVQAEGGDRMSEATKYDVIVIGTSQGGRFLPITFANAGRKVAVVERGHQFGRVGMSEEEATKQGRNIRVAKLPMNAVIRASETDETRGFMKAIVDADTKQILGCAVLGLEVARLWPLSRWR
jgi:pyruvate/2-oxoglutarate dehydrogenase complex dihydrolipoamide dehydrogenase (E3) component